MLRQSLPVSRVLSQVSEYYDIVPHRLNVSALFGIIYCEKCFMLLTKVLIAFNKSIPFCQMANGQLGALPTHVKFVNKFHNLLFCRSRLQRNIVQPLSISDLNFNEENI